MPVTHFPMPPHMQHNSETLRRNLLGQQKWRESHEDSPFFTSCTEHYPLSTRYAELLQSSCDVMGKRMDISEKPIQGFDVIKPEPNVGSPTLELLLYEKNKHQLFKSRV